MQHLTSILFSSVTLCILLIAGCRSTLPPSTPNAALVDSVLGGPPPAVSDYRLIVSENTKTDEGLFDVHVDEEDVYFEIDLALLDREMLLISRIAQTPANLSPFINGGSKVAEQVIRWEKKGNRILLRKMSYQNVAPDSLPVYQSVQVNNFEPILHAFDIEAYSEDSLAIVINVNDLFEDDIRAISGLSSNNRSRFKVRRLDRTRTFIDEVKSFPENVNVRHTLTFEADEPPSNFGTGTLSLQMYQSMILLPTVPMMPRLADERVGYFTVEQVDFGLNELKAGTREYIRRWRLEPSDQAAYRSGVLVDPVKPIVYYLDPATPERWRPYFCQGVEDWQIAFEAAGFKNAIQCRYPPIDDENFDPEDVRFSMVRYVANTTRNAVGPSVSDPRSGEIIESDIIWYHNHMRSYRNRLMIETAAANGDARSLDIPEVLIGETMRQVIAHEIGHALGLPHNMIASSSFPVDSLRSRTFTSQFGVAPSIMDYARQNYIAQPGDGVQRFVRKIGPYDHYAINWGYRWYPNVEEPENELGRLNELITAHADNPIYRFRSSRGFNPDAQTEDLGDDPVAASTYAIANLKRVLPRLVEWTSTPGKPYDDLEEIYGEFLGQWSRYIGHVITLIGGVYESPKTADQEGEVYEIVSKEEQERAIKFLTEEVFVTPDWLLEPGVLRRIEPAGAVDRLRGRQVSLLNRLLSTGRLQRLIEAEAIDSGDSYTLLQLFSDLQEGIWDEIDMEIPFIGTFRRNLQRGYLERMAFLMNEDTQVTSGFIRDTQVDVSQSDIRPLIRGELRSLQGRAQSASLTATDTLTMYHLEDVVARIDQILNSDE